MMRTHDPDFWNRPIDVNRSIDTEARDHSYQIDFLLARIRAETERAQEQRERERKHAEERAREAEQHAIRTPEYHRAEQAALEAGANLTSELKLHIRHLVDLAFEEPQVTISWMSPRSRARKLTSGESHGSRRTIVTRSIRDLRRDHGLTDVATFLHELGHQRDQQIAQRSTCEREVIAWRWALANALAWNRDTHQHMTRCILTYADAEKRDVLGIQAIEALIGEPFEQYERALTGEQIAAFEDAEFIREHGEHDCQYGRYCARKHAPATALQEGRFVCRFCYLALETDRQVRAQLLERSRPMTMMTDLERQIANQQRQRAAMRTRAQRVTGDSLLPLMRRVLAKTEICADCRIAPATHVAKEFGTDDRIIPTDWYRPVCASCLPGAKALQSRIQLVRQWQAEVLSAQVSE